MIQKAINKEGFSDIPLELKGYDVFYYFSPFSKRLYTKLNCAKKDMSKYEGDLVAYKSALETILEAANGTPKVPQAAVEAATQPQPKPQPKPQPEPPILSTDTDEVLALKKMLVILAKELMFERQEKQEKDDLIATYTAALIDRGMTEEEVDDMAPAFSSSPETFDFKTDCMTKKHMPYLSFDISDFSAIEKTAYRKILPPPGRK